MIEFRYNKPSSFKIDITSLIDVVFLIIIFLILSLGKIHSFLNIELPRLEDSGVTSSSNIPVLAIQKTETSHYNILWNGKDIELLELEFILKEQKPDKIILKIDKNIPYGFVVEVFARIQKNQNIQLYLEYEVDSN